VRFWASIAAIVVVVIGVVWTLQGVNVLGGSFMSGQSQWLAIGIALSAVGLFALWWLTARGAGRR